MDGERIGLMGIEQDLRKELGEETDEVRQRVEAIDPVYHVDQLSRRPALGSGRSLIQPDGGSVSDRQPVP